MNNLTIRFSHNYTKLHNQKSAKLLASTIQKRSQMNADFILYDTVYFNEKGEKAYFDLSDETYIVLVFIGDKMIPFTTARPYTKEKYDHYYAKNLGKIFSIHVKGE